MEMNLDQILVAHGQQAVALNVLGDVIINGVLGEILALDEQLGIKLEFKHGIILNLRRIFGSHGHHVDNLCNTTLVLCTRWQFCARLSFPGEARRIHFTGFGV